MNLRMKRPSPALVVAMVALFVALGGAAGAVVTAAVPLAKRALVADKAKLAKRALVADNAKKLGGVTNAQLGAAAAQLGKELALSASPAGPRPASAASSLVSTKTATWSLDKAQGNDFTVTCDSGQRAIAGGYDNPIGAALAFDTRPSSDGGSWRIFLENVGSIGPAAGTLYAVCLK